jgi:hypothetical protein
MEKKFKQWWLTIPFMDEGVFTCTYYNRYKNLMNAYIYLFQI